MNLGALAVLAAGALGRAAPPDVAIMIHGAGGGGWEYAKWRPVFESAGWTVVARDLAPVAGGLEQTRFDDYVDQVVSWVPKERGRLVLIGASMGGILALKAGERLKPDAVVLVNATPPKGVGPKREARNAPPVVRWANGPIEETRDAMPDSDEATIQFAWKRWRDESGAVLNGIREGIEATPPRFPVLVVLGERDLDIPFTTGLEIAKWANADVHLYHRMSHVGPLLGTRAQEVSRAALKWLEHRR